jgi:hypothetical protein
MFVLNGCASTFDSVYLCGLDLTNFSVAWLVDGQVIGTNIQLSDVATGPGTPFAATGNYDVLLSIDWRADPSVSDTDTAVVTVRASKPVSISEPAAIFLYGVGLLAIGVIGWRRRAHPIRGPDKKRRRS